MNYQTSLKKRFFKFTQLPFDGSTTCWEWKGCRNLQGYGFLLKTLGKKQYVQAYAHRVAYELHTGRPIGEGLQVCHTCDHPWCVNPHHLFLATQTENMQDAKAKGRLGGQKITHCPQGHAYTGDNLHITTGNNRKCKTCDRERHRKKLLDTRSTL
jgi:hypothetical protein